MKENVNRFLEKAAVDQVLAEKLAVLQKQHFQQLAALAEENGLEVTWEDFAEAVQCLNDEEVEAASGGYNPRSSAGYYDGYV